MVKTKKKLSKIKTKAGAKKAFNKIASGAKASGAKNPDAVAASQLRKAGKSRFLGRGKPGK